MNAKVSLTRLGLGNANGVLIYGLYLVFSYFEEFGVKH